MNQSHSISFSAVLGLIVCSILFSTLSAQELEMKRFVLRGVNDATDIASIDSVIRSFEGTQMLRTDLNTLNCVGVFEEEFAYTKQDFKSALTPLGYDLKCYASAPYTSQLFEPINPHHCRESSPSLFISRGIGACCQTGGNGSWGCENAACEAAICGADPFCCDNTWDGLCATDAQINANGGGACAGVSDCPGLPAAGPCCQAGGNGSPGCEDPACEAAVCAIDPFCCNSTWDGLCATTAVDNADLGGACSGVSDCPTGAALNPCCTAHPFTGCENTACQIAICNLDPFCCDTQWDALCAADAVDNANNSGPCSGVSDCPSGGPVTASDCDDAIDICTNINFQINPNGFGTINEIPALGTTGNPNLTPDGTLSAWGTDNWGCLRSGELNSTWMIVNIQTGGVLQFTFGGLATQTGFYDWIMYMYDSNSCTNIPNNTVAPVRCNWNAAANGGTGLANPIPPGGNAGNYEPPLNVNAGDQFIICFSNWSSVTTNVPLEFGGTAEVSCTPLPVELLHFSGKKNGEDALLNWSTATEINNDLFYLKRSTDAENWKAIAQIAGHGNSNQQIEYTYRDLHPKPELYYYRLYQQDFNGSPELIGTTAIDLSNDGWNAFPNPSSGTWRIQNNTAMTELKLELRDVRGKPVAFRVDVKNNELEVQLSQPQSGLYFLEIRNASGALKTSLKLMVY